jgi:regulatory protein
VLDRPALRRLRQELRRAEALAVAGRALRTRELSKRSLAERLARRHVSPAAAAQAVDAFARAGLLDDDRVARNRAEALAQRGYGDAAIRHDLERHGLEGDVIQGALGGLEPEGERARRAIERRGAGPRTARYLAGRGFAAEIVAEATGPDFANDP